MKTYLPERPVNAAVISPLFDHVIVGGALRAQPVAIWAEDPLGQGN